MCKKEDNLLKDIVDIIYDGYEVLFDRLFKIKENKELLSQEINQIWPTLPQNISYKLPTKEDAAAFRIPLGESYNNKIVYWNPNSIPHVLCCGATGSGKSVCTKSVLTSILNMFTKEQIEVILIDFKIIELFAFRDCKQVINYTYEVEDALQLITEALNECRNRYRLFQDAAVTNLKDYNKKAKDKLKYQFIFIEEFIVLSQHKNGIKMLNELISLSRAAGIFIYISCQRPDHTVISPLLKANTGNKICFRTEDSKNSVIVLDREGSEALRGNGHGILKQGSTFTEFQGYYITDQQVKKLVAAYKVEKSIKVNEAAKEYEPQKDNKIIDLKFLDNL